MIPFIWVFFEMTIIEMHNRWLPGVYEKVGVEISGCGSERATGGAPPKQGVLSKVPHKVTLSKGPEI